MSRLWIPAILCSTILAAPAAGQQRNLVLNRPYDYHPNPRYSDSKDEGDIRQLTDGKTFPSSSLWMQKSTVGWIAGLGASDSGPVVIHFDLGAEATLSELRFHSAGGGAAGVVEVGLKLFVSLDDQTYVLAGELPAPRPKGGGYPITLRVPLTRNDTRARYVAVVAMAPAPHYFVFADEIELIGTIPAHPSSILPIQVGVSASGAKGLGQLFAGGNRAAKLASSLTAPVKRHIANWPAQKRDAQGKDLEVFAQAVRTQSDQYDNLRAQFTEQHRLRAREVYAADTLVWEVVPDDRFTMLSLPDRLSPDSSGTIHTVINALEATALGASNLTDRDLPLMVSISGGGDGAPRMTIRVARFFVTSNNARYVPDALLANDCPQVIPSGESKLIWLEADSSDNASPGAYSYQITVEIGAYSQVIDLTVQVHDVTLDTETPLSVGNWSSTTSTMTAAEELRAEMLDHRQTTAELGGTSMILPLLDAYGEPLRPVQINLASLARELAHHQDFNQVGWFISFDRSSSRPQREMFGSSDWMSAEFQEIFGEWIAAVVASLQANGRSYDEFYLQFFDETLVDVAAEITALTKSFDPNVRVMLTIPRASIAATQKQVDAGLDISAYHAPQIEYDNPQDGFPMLSSGGRELWFYNAGGAEEVGRECDPLTWYRYMYWSAFYHGATGVHFWTLVRESARTGGWDETNQVYYLPMIYLNTDQQNLPPDVVTAEVVIPSRRWEYSRMGTEDYMLLKMAQDKIAELGAAGNPYRNQLRRIIRDVLTHRENRILFRAKRRELVELVEKLAAR